MQAPFRSSTSASAAVALLFLATASAQTANPGRRALGVGARLAAPAAAPADAQQAAAAVQGSVAIRDLIGTGRQALIKTPEYRTSNSRSPTRPREWAQILLTYDTAPEWIDVLTIQYHVMSVTKVDGQREYSLYTLTIDYLDVERGREHQSTVFLTPAAVKRYGPPVAVHVQLLVGGVPVASEDDLDASMKGQLPEQWWENRQVLDSEHLTTRQGYLLRRSETPFAFVNIDDYEVMR